MRQKVRRLSKSAVSVLLAIVMVVSMMSIGLVSINAATFQTGNKIYFDASAWTSRTKVYINFLNSDSSYGRPQEMTQISNTGIYYFDNNSVSGDNNYGVMFFTNNGWDNAGSWNSQNGWSNVSQYAANYTSSYGTNIYTNHVYYFRAESSSKGGSLALDNDYTSNQYTIEHDTVRNTDRIWAFNLTAKSSVATTPAGTPATTNASDTAGGQIAVNAAYFNGWNNLSGNGDSTPSSTTSTYTNAAKGSTVTFKVKQVYAGYAFDGWYSDASSTGTTNRLSTDQNYTRTVTGDKNGTITVYAHFHRAQATITTAVSPSGAGTAQVSTSQSGTYASSVTVQSDTNVYLKAENTNNRYEFSEWQAVSGLTFTDRTSAQTTAKATATATATAVFLPINYNLSRQNPTHAKIKIPTQARWGDTVTPSATTDTGYKIDNYKWSQDGGSTWETVAPGSGFTMPEHDVIVSADVTECTTYTVTMTPSGSGTISAKTAEGQTISSGDSVNEGTVITFTAAPASNTAFTAWSGTGSAASISGTDSEKTVTINADTSVTATFTANVIQLVTYGTSNTATQTPTATTNMNLMESTGYYRSATKVTSGGATGDTTGTVFSVKRTIAGVTTYAKSAASGNTWWITDSMPAVTPQHWTSDNTLDKKYRDKLGTSGTQHYVFYDPETNKIWLSANADGSTGVKVIAKDGSFVDNAPSNPTTSAGWGDTTLKVSTNSGTSWSNGTSANSGYAQTYTLTNAQVESETTKIKVSTTVSKANYYVYGFDINGCVTKKATKNNSAYELEFSPADIETNTSNFIEITPIYMLTDPSLTDPNATPTTIRFYVRSFSGDIKARWGGELYCYAYNNSTNTNGDWPGQPMVNLGGGTYYMDLPVGTEAITLSNAAADWIHATTLGVDLSVSDTWVTRNQYQCQSYDYDDFKYIYAKPGVGENDEDIIFDFKYKQGDWGKSGLDNFNTLTTSSNQSSFPSTLTPGSYSGWEDYTDLYGDKIDLWGTKLTSNYNNNPVRIVVQGYYDTSAVNNSYYATTYVVYKPSSTTGSNPSYSLVTYTDASGYGKKSRSEFLQRSAAQMGLTDLAGQPVQITYEYALYHDVSTAGTKDKDNQFAERADGVWYYSETKPVKGNIIIQYAENMHSAFTDDTFEIDEENHGIDYDGDEYTVNVGTTTNAKAYFVDNNYGRTPRVLTRPTNAPLDVDYDGRTVEWAYTDAYDYFDVKAEESPDGEYTFIGWYKMSGGKPEFASAEYTYQVEASANETFIARYVKTPAGQVKLAHKPVVTNNSEGTGNRKVWYDIVSSSDLNTSLLPSGTTQEANGAITVPKTYVKYGKNYVLKVKFEVDPDSNSLKHGIYSTDTATNANLLTEAGLELHNSVSVDNFALSPSGTTATLTTDYVEFSIPIDRFFKLVEGTDNEYEFDADKSLIEVFSDYERITNSINITKTVDYNNGDAFTINVKEQYVPDPAAPETTAFRNYSGKYTVGTDDAETSFTGDITISGGQTIHIVDTPAGTVFQISESSLPAAYNYGSVSITGVTGTDITQGKQFTMRNDGDVDMTFNNTIKKAAVKVKKVVQDGDSGTTTFPITATIQVPGGSSQTVQNFNLAKNEEGSLGELPVGTTISISEDPTSGYEQVGVTCDGTYVQTNASAFKVAAETTGTNNGLITVTNKKLHNVTVTKTTDWDDYDSNFRIQVLTSTDGTNYTAYNGNLTGTGYNATTQQTVAVTRTAVQAGTTYYYDIKKSDNLTIPNLATGTYVKIVETNSTENYNFNSATVENEQTGTETAISTAPKGVQFRVGTTDAAVTIDNEVIRHNVTVTKKTFVKNGSTYTDFPYNDGSTFGVKVLFRLLGNSDASAYVPISGGKVNGTASDPADGIYTVEKDGVITFTGIPKGSFIAVSEDNANISASNVTMAQRFAFDSTIINSGEAATGANENAKYVKVADADVSLDVRNIVKQTDVQITKTTNNSDTTSLHTIQVHVYKNGKASLTGGIEYGTLTYTTTKDANTHTVAAGGDITIVGGETLTFHYPVGSVVTVKETAPNANFDFSSITVTDAAQGVSGIDDPTTVNGLLTFQTKDAVAAVNITNNIKTKNLTITKATNVTSTTDAFKIKLYTSTDNTNWTPYTTALKSASGSNTLAASDSEYTIHKGEQWVMQNLPINTYVKIEESDYNSAAGYTFDGMTGGSVTVDSSARTGVVQMDDDKAVTINNNKYHDVTINKVLTNSNNSSAKFKISATVNGETTWTRSIAGATEASGSLTDMEITAGQSIVLKDVPVGAAVEVSEPTDTAGFSFVSATYSLTGSNTTGSNATDAKNVSFEMADSNATVTVNNKINNKTFTVKKVTDSHDGSGFGIKVEYKQTNSGADWTNYGGTGFTSGVVTLAHDGTASVSVPSDASVRITETTVTSGYQFVSISDGTNTYTTNSGTVFDGIVNGDTIIVTNRKLYTVTLTKNLTSSITNDSTEFKINYSYRDKNNNSVEGYALLGNNATRVLSDIPAGTVITVTEDAKAGYTNTGSSATANITKSGDNFTVNGDGTITINNSLKTKTLRLKKIVDKTYTADATFPVQVEYLNGSTWTTFGTYDVSNDGTTETSVTLTGVAAESDIKVTENYAGSNYDTTLTKIQVGTGALSAAGTTSTTLTNPANNTLVTFYNYCVRRDVKISKTANYTAAGPFGFTFTDSADGLRYQKYDETDSAVGTEQIFGTGAYTFNLTSGQYIIVKNVPIGTALSVEETNAQGATTTTNTLTGVSGTAGTTTANFTVTNAATQEVAFTNSANKTLTITKTKPAGDNDFTDNTTTFQIQVTKGSNPYTGTAGTDYTADTGVTLENGVFSLKMGQSVVINVQNDEQYEVKEINIDSKYTLTNVSATGSDSDVTNGKHFTIGNDNASVTFTNTVKRHKVTVSKTVTDYDSNYDPDFSITATVTKPGQSATTQTGSIKHNGSFEITNLPMGTTVTAAENAPEGFTLDSITYGGGLNSSGVLATDADGTITVTNRLNTKTLKLQKAVTGWEHLPTTTFPVKVQYYDNSQWNDYTTVNLSTNGTVQDVVLKGVAATARIKVIEDLTGITYCDATATTIKVGDEAAVTGTSTDFDAPADNTTVLITNSAKLSKVTVKKAVSNYDADFATRFPITVNITYPDNTTTTVSAPSGGLEHNGSFDVNNLPVGTTFTVTETVPAGYTQNADTYTGVTKSGSTYTVGSTDGTVTVNNTLKTKTLKVKKASVDFAYNNETTFPISVYYWNGTEYVLYTDSETISTSDWTEISLKGVAADAKLKVTEDLPAGTNYDATLTTSAVTNGTKTAGGASSIEFTSAANATPEVTFNNFAKKATVTVKKVITNFVTGDTTAFPITATVTKPSSAATNSSGTLAHNGTFQIADLPIGTTIVVNEDLTGISGYTLDRIEGDSNISKNGDTFTVGSANATITVYNRRDTSGFTIKKETDVNNTSDSFKIKIWTSNNGTDWTAYTSAIGTFTADTNEEYTIHKNSELTIEGLMANTYIKVQETDGMTSKYTSAVTGLGSTQLETGSDNTTGIVKIGGTGQGITITNTTIKKNVTIHKDVLHYANTTDSFNVNVTLESEEGASKTYTYTGAASGTLTNKTQGTIALKNNETVTIANVPIGTIVTVTEQTLTGRYSFGSIDVANANKDNAASTGQTVKFTTNNTTADAAVTIQNDVKTHDIEITKNVLNSTAAGVTFPISVSIKPLGASDTEVTSWNRKIGTASAATGSLTNMAIGNNESITIYGVPEGAQVVVTEGTTTNFSCYGINATYTDTPISIPDSNSDVDNCTFTVPNSDVDVKVNVAVQNNINNRNVTITKHVDDGASDSVTFPIKIEVKKTTDADFVVYNDGSHADGVYAFNPTGTMTITVPLDAQVKVTEQNTIPTGFAFESIVCGSDTVTNAQTYTFTGTLSDTADKTITVNNTKLHKLTVTKTVEGTANTTDTFTFKAYKWNGSAWANETTFTLTAGTSHDAFTNVRKGEMFKVVEVVPDKYTYDTTASKTKVTGADTSTTSYTAVDDTTEKGFQNIVMGTSDVNVTVNNIVKTKNVTISKTADYTGTDTFTFNVKTKAEGASEASNCTYQYKLNGTGSDLNFTNGNVVLERGQNIVIYNVPVDTEVTVRETNAGNATSASAVITNAKSGTDNYDSATKTATFTVGATADPSVAFTNSKNKTLTITKTKPTGDNDFTDNTTTFQIQVKKNNAAYTGTAGTNYTASNGVTLLDGVFTLKMGDTVVLNVTNGEQYEISEINIDSKYTLTNVSATGSDGEVTNGKHFTIGNDNASVTFENSIKRANVTVQKLVSDYNSGDDEFPITVSYTKPGMAADSTTYNLKKDATDTLANLPYGTQVTVSETLTGDMAKKYQLATDGIKYTRDGSETTGASFTMTDKNVAVTVTNERKPYTVDVVKVVEGDNTDSTAFTVNVNGTDQTITQSTGYSYTAYYGDTVTVSETNLPRGYQLASIGNGTNTVTSGELATTVTGNTTVTVTNTNLPTYTLTLTKEAGSEAGNTEFGITVSSETASGNYSYRIGSGDAVAFDTNSKVITLKAGENAVISGLLAGETLSFVETNQGAAVGYTFDHFTVNGSDLESTVTTLTYEVSAGTNNIVVHNVKSAPDEYRYKITYTYPSRFQFIPEKASRFGDQNYTVEGVLLSNDTHFSEYFDTANSKITKALILAKAPHESNFMMNMTWDKDGDDDSNFSFIADTTSGTTVYTGSVRMIEEEQSTKNVQFIFPYEITANTYPGMCKVVYVPTDYANPVKLPEKQTTTAIQVDYQGEVVASDTREVTYTENGETKTKNETFYYHTTAPSQFNGGNFLYWSIRAKNINTNKYEEVARSYNEIFNYTIFDNYQIEPIYDNYEGVDKTDEANYKATAQFAKLNLLAITRNQWNNGDKGSENVNLKGEDMVYLDFDLAYAFNDYQLSKNSKTLETGLLIQDCGIAVEDEHPLNLDGNQTKLTEDYAYYAEKAAEKETANTLKSASALQALVLANYQACGTSGSKTEPEEGLTRYAIGKVLTNKNRYELGVTNVVGTISQDNTDVLTGWNYDSSKKTHVYRAYAYIRNTKVDAHGVILSEPVYFTMKNIAEQ